MPNACAARRCRTRQTRSHHCPSSVLTGHASSVRLSRRRGSAPIYFGAPRRSPPSFGFLLPSARARARASPLDHPSRTLVLRSVWPVCSATASSPRHASCQCVPPSLVRVALRCAAQVRQAPAVIASDPMSPMSPRISPDKPMVRYAPQRTTAHHSAPRHAAMRRAFRPTECCGAALPCRPTCALPEAFLSA
jgi:hypothetical protein